MPTRGMERWLVAADVRPAGRVARPRGRRVRERRLPVAAPPRRRRGRDRLGHRRGHRSVAARARGLAAAGGRRGAPRRAVARGAVAPPRRSRARRPTRCAGRGAWRRCATSPSSSTATRCTGRRWSAPGRRAPTTTARAACSATPDAGSPSCGAGCASASASRTSPRASTTRARGCARSPSCSTSRRACGCSASPACPPGTCRSCARIAAGRDVHLFLLHPSPGLWDRDRAGRRPAGRAPRRGPDRRAARQPPAVVLGRRRTRDAARARRRRARRTTTTRSRTRAGTLLGRIQADVHADREPPGAPLPGRLDERPLLDAGDRSIQVHACHGRARQVEVLRDAILHLLEDDPTLEPRDVIVMCPDIETFASLIQATFGAGEVDGRRGRGRHAARRRPPARPPRAAGRPRAAPDEPGARRRRPAHRARGRAGHGVAGARPRRPRARPPPLRPRRRRSRADRELGRRQRHPLGARRRAPRAVQARRAARAGTWSAGLDRVLRRRRDDRGAPAALRGRPAARRRRLAATSSSPGASPSSIDRLGAALDALGTAADDRRVDVGARRRGRRAHDDRPPRRLAARGARPDPRRRRARGRATSPTELDAAGGPRAAGRAAAGPADARELPHRPPDRSARSCRCGRCRTASSACSGWTRASSRASRRATATTSCSARRTSATATRAARTASCCSTRCSRRPTGSSSPTRATTSARTPSARPPCR